MRTAEIRDRMRTERLRLERARAAVALGGVVRLGTQQESTGELSGADDNVADHASDTFEREVELSLLHALDEELAGMAAAEMRLRAGTYGRCLCCGAQIDDARLEVVPWATLCVRHQQEAELEGSEQRWGLRHGPASTEGFWHFDLLPVDGSDESSEVCAEEAAIHIQVA